MSRVGRLKDEGTRSQVVVAGAVAGLVSRCCIAPLDVVKIRLQLQHHSLSDPLEPPYKGIWSTLTTVRRQEGIRAWWKGNTSASLLYVCYGGAQFVAYRSVNQALTHLPVRLHPSAESFVSGASAGAIATVATYPLDLLRTRFAAQGTERIYSGILASVRDVSRYEGLRGFFRGCTASIVQIVPYMGLFFTSYEIFHQMIGGKKLPFSSGDALAGVMASVLAKTAVFPLDLMRKRLQVQGPTRSRYVHGNIPEYRGIFGSLLKIYRREGYRGWYRGLTVSLVKNAPLSAITMYVYERTLHLMMRMEPRDKPVNSTVQRNR